MLLFGGVADDEALESSTFFNDVYACCAARAVVAVTVVLYVYVVCVTLCAGMCLNLNVCSGTKSSPHFFSV